MKVLFSIKFNYRNRVHSGIVRVTEAEECTEYAVRIMNSRLDHWLCGHHEYRTTEGKLCYQPSGAPDRTEKLRQAVFDGLFTWLKNRKATPPPPKGGHRSGRLFYIHAVRP